MVSEVAPHKAEQDRPTPCSHWVFVLYYIVLYYFRLFWILFGECNYGSEGREFESSPAHHEVGRRAHHSKFVPNKIANRPHTPSKSAH